MELNLSERIYLSHRLVEEGDDGVCLEGVLVQRDVQQLQEEVRVAVVLGQRRLKCRPGPGRVAQLQAHEASIPGNGQVIL